MDREDADMERSPVREREHSEVRDARGEDRGEDRRGRDDSRERSRDGRDERDDRDRRERRSSRERVSSAWWLGRSILVVWDRAAEQS